MMSTSIERPFKACTECGVDFPQTMFESHGHFKKRATCGRYACVKARTRKRQAKNGQRHKERQAAA